MRDDVLMKLVDHAAADPGFRALARADLDGALAQAGFELAPDELAAVRDLQALLAELNDEEIVDALAARGRQGGL